MDRTRMMRGSKHITQIIIKLLTCRKTRQRRSWKRGKTIWFLFSVGRLFLSKFFLLLFRTILQLLSRFGIGLVAFRCSNKFFK